MNEERTVRISKYLSKHLRHQPERLGLELGPGGWVEVADLLAACRARGKMISQEELADVVASNSKQRFSFDGTGTLIRANQGHSVEVDLQLQPRTPPHLLYHGTGHRSVEMILQDGLLKMSRHHVHLSTDIPTAVAVGARHGRPVIFTVDALAMQHAGHLFYCSSNGVWLVEHVPPQYLRQIDRRI